MYSHPSRSPLIKESFSDISLAHGPVVGVVHASDGRDVHIHVKQGARRHSSARRIFILGKHSSNDAE
jgi:hypothetical protein